MKRTVTSYILLTLLFALGLWGILRYGATLRAPPDLSGEWMIEWNPLLGPTVGFEPPEHLHIIQSGLSLDADLRGRENIHLRGQLEGASSDRRQPVRVSVALRSAGGSPWQLTIHDYSGGDQLTGELISPTSRSFTAHRLRSTDTGLRRLLGPSSQPFNDAKDARD